MYTLFLKRVVDIVLSVAALIVLAPVVVGVAFVVWATLGSPLLFRQYRPGKNGRPFTILKFRTMRPSVSGEDDGRRLTATGAMLRSLSLDELPEFLNVLRGDMSIVGPRPLLTQYLGRYTPEQARRHDVRPGITGWAQVHGRNALSWEDKFRYDVWYVDHCSFWLDMRILGVTLWKIMRREGISAPGHVTSHEFMGSARS